MKKIAVLLTMLCLLCSCAFADSAWVLCHPDSYVTLRSRAKKDAPDFGGVQCGSRLTTDGKIRNGFLHVYDLAAEESSGWISTRYIVYTEPREIRRKMEIKSDGRVACRKWVQGKITGWAYTGDVLYVYWACEEWAVTSRGYVMTKFLQEVPDAVQDL